jgi:hypothetical protein
MSTEAEAFLSECRAFRYWLTRIWDRQLPLLAVIGVNPSTADERKDDATIRKDMGFAQRLGYGGILKLNVGAFRSTDPVNWRKATDPIGPLNTAGHLRGYADEFGVKRVVAAWGRNGKYAAAQCAAICEAFPELWCWGRNDDGTPRHPLMLPYWTELVRFEERP